MKRLLLAVILAVFLIYSNRGHADDFVFPSDLALLQTMLRFGALDINNDVIIDDYAKIAECDLYSTFRRDDFKWNKIREGLRNKIRSESITYPTNYQIKGLISLDRYDFNTKMFKIGQSAALMGVNAFRMLELNAYYCNSSIKILPKTYTASLEARINVPGFVMGESDAQSLLSRLNKTGNTERQIVAKSNFKITGVPKVGIDHSDVNKWYDPATYVGKRSYMVMDAKLDSIEFFEDEEMKRRIFVYRP